jgi:hypothetical protein
MNWKKLFHSCGDNREIVSTIPYEDKHFKAKTEQYRCKVCGHLWAKVYIRRWVCISALSEKEMNGMFPSAALRQKGV